MRALWLCIPVLAFSIVAACSSSSSSGTTTNDNTDGGGNQNTDSGNQTTGGGGSATVTGNENGAAVTATNALAIFGTQAASGTASFPTNYALVIISSKAVTCDQLKTDSAGNVQYANFEALELIVENESDTSTGTPPAITAQKYTVSASPTPDANGNINVVTADYTSDDDKCVSSGDDTAESGSITFTAASDTSLTGSFDVTFKSGAHLTGDFTPTVCTGLTLAEISDSNAGDDAGTPTCQQ